MSTTFKSFITDVSFFQRGMVFFPHMDSGYAQSVENPPFISTILKKNRPLLVVSVDSSMSIVTVIPTSTDNNAAEGKTSIYKEDPYYVPFTRADGTPSLVCVPQMKPCPVTMLGDFMYILSPEVMDRVDEAMSMWLGGIRAKTNCAEPTSLKELTELISNMVKEEVHRINIDNCPIKVDDVVAGIKNSISTAVSEHLGLSKAQSTNCDPTDNASVPERPVITESVIPEASTTKRRTRIAWPEFTPENAYRLKSMTTEEAMDEFNLPDSKTVYRMRYLWGQKLKHLNN